MTVLFQLASWHWYYLILLYQMGHILSHSVPATILFQVQVTKILLCLTLRHHLHLPNIRIDLQEGPAVTQRGQDRSEEASPQELLNRGEEGTEGVPWTSRTGTDGRGTAQRETAEKPPNAERNQDSERGDLTERRQKGPRRLRAINLTE